MQWARTAAVVLAVASIAAVVSYSHIYALGRAHGQGGTAARLLPLSVDGLIVASGLVLLHAARRQDQAPVLARWMLWLGIAAAVGANVSYGLPFGPLGAVVSAWPAVAFIGSAEMALGMVRSARPSRPELMTQTLAPAPPQVAPDAESAARMALAASVAAGNALSQRADGSVRAHPRSGAQGAPGRARREQRACGGDRPCLTRQRRTGCPR